MKKQLLCIFMLFSISTFCQIEFEKGYIINSSGNKIECFIKNMQWSNNPSSIEYRITQTSEILTATTSTINEFAIEKGAKYISAAVSIDYSSDDFRKASDAQEPVWVNAKLFLKSQIEGTASLYYFNNGDITRYFYKTATTPIEQLVYRVYIKIPENNSNNADNSNTGYAVENKDFRKQLWQNMKMDKYDIDKMEMINYTNASLFKYFNQYNSLKGNSNVAIAFTEKNKWRLKAVAGINSSTYSYIQGGDPYTYKKGASNLRLGIEGEYFIGINKNKHSIFMEPSINNLTVTSPAGEYLGTPLVATINFRGVELNLGYRSYFYINKQMAFFATASLCAKIASKSSSIGYENGTGNHLSYPSNTSTTRAIDIGLGAGFAYKKISAEIKYRTIQDYLEISSYDYATRQSQIAFTLSYVIFNKN